MSDTRPRPRPRPRARPVTAQSSSSNIGTSDTFSTEDVVINDSDELFVVNRGRTAETWKKLDEINEITSHASSGSESDKPSIPLRKRVKKDVTPQWRKDQRGLRILSSDESSNDSDLEILADHSTPGKGKDPVSPSKRKRQGIRPKSRSITPPPDLPPALLANARNILNRAIDAKRAPSPIIFDDFDSSMDTIVLDPELERIAKAVNAQSNQTRSIPSFSGQTKEQVVISVKWQRYPLNPAELEPTWSFHMDVDESFRGLFEVVARNAQLLVDALVLTYRNKRIYPSTRPDSLKLWGEAQLTACHRRTHEYIQQEAREAHKNLSPVRSPLEEGAILQPAQEDTVHILSDDEDDSNDDVYATTATTNDNPPHTIADNVKSPSPKASQEESDAEPEDSTKFRLVLRSNKGTKNITLIVRPTTKCGAVVKAYVNKIGLAERYPHLFSGTLAPAARGRGQGRAKVLPDPRISVDGEKLDNASEIGEALLEDGDMIDVVGL